MTTQVPGLPLPPVSTITPFTYREGVTLLRLIKELTLWIDDELIPWVGTENNGLRDYIDQVKVEIENLVSQYKSELDETKADWDQRYDLLMSSLIDLIGELNDQAVANLVNSETSVTRAALNTKFLRRNHDYFVPEDYVIGDTPTNWAPTFTRVITAAQGKPIILESGKDYPVAYPMVNTNCDKIDMRTSGVEPAIVSQDKQGNGMVFFQPGGNSQQDGGVVAVETLLTESVGILDNGWLVANPTGIEPGMLCAVVSSKLWYHDPRPGTGEARKSELHKVSRVEGLRVYFEDPANDGYNVAIETVALKFYRPLKIRMENITFRATHPEIAEETAATMGVRIDFSDNPQIINVNAENCARTGIYLNGTYRGLVDGGLSKGSNNFYNGYGVSISGSAFTRVTNRTIAESRRGVDITSNAIGLISRSCTIDHNKCIGGGKNSRGENYGWNDDGTVGAYQGGFGSHGGADNITYSDNETIDMHAHFTIRGRNTYIHDNTMVGRSQGGAIWATEGVNLFVDNNRLIAGYWMMKDRQPYNGSEFNIDYKRADTFITIYPTWKSNPEAGVVRGILRIAGNHAEVRTAFLRMALFHKGETYIEGNNIMLVHPTPGTPRYILDIIAPATTADVTPGFLRLWTFANNSYRNPVATGDVKLANFSVEGMNMVTPVERGTQKVVQMGYATQVTPNPPFTAGQVVTVVGTFEKPFRGPSVVTASTSVPARRINIRESSYYRTVIDITMDTDWTYEVGATYAAQGVIVDYLP